MSDLQPIRDPSELTSLGVKDVDEIVRQNYARKNTEEQDTRVKKLARERIDQEQIPVTKITQIFHYVGGKTARFEEDGTGLGRCEIDGKAIIL